MINTLTSYQEARFYFAGTTLADLLVEFKQSSNFSMPAFKAWLISEMVESQFCTRYDL